MKSIKYALLTVALNVAAVAQTTIATWTFETSIPTSGGPLAPEMGAGTAISNTGGTFSNPAGNGSTESWSSNGWGVGEYFQFGVAGGGASVFTVSWDQTGSNTGPRDFTLSYSLDGSSYAEALNYAVSGVMWSPTSQSSTASDDFTKEIVLPQSVTGSIIFRLTATSITAINGESVAGGGTGRVDNFTVSAIPEPSTYAAILGMVALAGVVVHRRRRAGN